MMKRKFLSLLLVIAMLFSLALPALAAESEEAAEPVAPYTVPAEAKDSVVILHSNDVHGAIEGYAKMAALKAMYEAAGAHVLVVDAGDFSQGETSVSVSQGATAIELMNLAGYDAAAPGNHEFDYGYDNLTKLAESAQFPILAANITYNEELAFSDHLVLDAGETKVGLFGLDTPETASKAHPGKIKGVKFAGGEEMYAVAQTQVDALKAAGADVIVCVGHLGIDDETAATANRSIDLLGKVSGIDVFIDGHSHSTEDEIVEKTNAERKVGDTVITSTGTKFANIGVVTVKDGAITTTCVDTAAIPVKEDDPIAVRAAAIRAEIEADYGATFATTEVLLDGNRAPGVRTQETNLGDLIADALLWYATKDGELEVDKEHVIAITNGGGIRATIQAGNITKNDVNTVLPFGNTVAVAYVTGEKLLEILEASTFCTPEAVGAFPQVSGIQFSIDTTVAYDQGEAYGKTTYFAPKTIGRVTIDNINGKPFDPAATYGVVTNDFLAAGGDTYYALSTSATVVDTGTPMDVAVMEYIATLDNKVTAAKYGAPQGRINVKYVGLEGNTWYTEFAKEVMDKGLMTGTPNGFDAGAVVTRATVFQTLYNLAGKPEVTNKMATFPDAQGKWYENAARWAEQMELTTGTGEGKFDGDRAVTRAEIATILHRYYGEVEDPMVYTRWFEGEGIDMSVFVDGDDIPAWAEIDVIWCCMAGVIGGKDGNRLALGDTATRAELAKMLAIFVGYLPIEVEPEQPAGVFTAKVASISKYGNVTTDLTIEALTEAGFEPGDILSVVINSQRVILSVPYGTGYSNVDQGSAIALADGDTQTLALAINRGDFATTYGLGTKGEDGSWTITPDAPIDISMEEKGGYADELEMRDMDSKRTNNREDYSSDEVFANFRMIQTKGIAEGVLYRTSSPINPELGRNTYADKLIEKAGVKTIVNMADCANSMKEYEGYNDTYYAKQKIIGLNMGVDMYSEEALGDLKNGLEFMAENKGPYAIHCTEGKDRAGYFAFLLEALMGANLREIVGDYMKSYENYYFVVADSEQWSKIAESNIEKDVLTLTGAPDIFTAGDMDLQAAAKKYVLEKIGLSQENLDALKANLSTPIK